MYQKHSIELLESPSEEPRLEGQGRTYAHPRRGEVGSKSKILLFGVILAYNGLFMGFGFARFSTFFKFFMKGKFGSGVDSAKHDSVLSLLNTLFVAGLTASSLCTMKLFRSHSLTELHLVFMVCLAVSVVLQLWADLAFLYVLRVAIGFFSGGLFILGPILVNQCIPAQFRGALGLLFSVFIASGIILASSISNKTAQQHWQVFLVLLAPMELARLLVLVGFCRYESPYFIYKLISSKVGTKCARPPSGFGPERELPGARPESKSVRRLKHDEFVAHPKIELLVESFYRKSSWETQKTRLFGVVHKFFEDKKQLKGVCQAACSRDFRKQFVVSLILYSSNQLTGVNIYVMYSNRILRGLGMKDPNFYIFWSGRLTRVLLSAGARLFFALREPLWADAHF